MSKKIYIIIMITILMSLVIVSKDRVIISEDYNYIEIAKSREAKAEESTKSDPIIVGVTQSTDDSNSKYFQYGIELAVETINSSGGLLGGRKIELVFENSSSDVIAVKNYTQNFIKDLGIDLDLDILFDNDDVDNLDEISRAKNIAKNFIEDLDVVAVISSSPSEISIPVSIIYEFSGLIYISTAVTEPLFTRDDFSYVFRNIPDDIYMAKSLSRLADNLNFRDVVVLHSKSTYSEVVSDTFIENSVALGIDIAYRTSFTDKDKSFKRIVSEISPLVHKELDYDAIFMVGDIDTLSILTDELRESGNFAPIITTNSLDTDKLLDFGDSANGIMLPTYFSLEILNKDTQDFINLVQEKYRLLPNISLVQGYDSIMLLADAIKQARSTVPLKISETLKYLKEHKSVTGEYSMTPKGDITDKTIFFKKVVDNKFKFFTLK